MDQNSICWGWSVFLCFAFFLRFVRHLQICVCFVLVGIIALNPMLVNHSETFPLDNSEHQTYEADHTEVASRGKPLLFQTSSLMDCTTDVTAGSCSAARKLITLLAAVHSASSPDPLSLWRALELSVMYWPWSLMHTQTRPHRPSTLLSPCLHVSLILSLVTFLSLHLPLSLF